ncbi:GntR family transcriptional regulator [Cupriavidus basilensis OR16]|uniref:GntR family transcriptional regulator n=1 Tax=Cupriavidus basilensis OR16 TaxID=1127483 RepID=H1S4B1_9BURK|nr:GntR family transcriptional regulator [Cupriavidus basilensis OR16]
MKPPPANSRRHGRRTEYFRTNQEIHQLIIDGAANPVLAGIYATLMSKVHRARGAANADMLRWQDCASIPRTLQKKS